MDRMTKDAGVCMFTRETEEDDRLSRGSTQDRDAPVPGDANIEDDAGERLETWPAEQGEPGKVDEWSGKVSDSKNERG